MQHDILINWSPQETRVAIIEHGAVQELHIERNRERGLVGNVYLGKVARVLPGMQSAFIDIGIDKAAFLHVADLASSVHARYADNAPRNAPAPAAVTPIEKQVFEGQSIMVQVIKDPIGSKGARLSSQISLAGRQLVFLPQDDHMGISQKIPPAQRENLRARVQKLWDAHAAQEQFKGGGFILRTNAEEATDAELQDDMAYLLKTWQRIKLSATQLPAQSILHTDATLLQRVLRDMASEDTQTIRIDSRITAMNSCRMPLPNCSSTKASGRFLIYST
jgi:ribonuclease G